MLVRYSRQVLTAGKADEVVADSGGPLPNHSVFTGHLLEGLKGSASGENGVITANGLMAYVYNKVANDKNSRQTPHFGYFDGDGDFIISAPGLFAKAEPEVKDVDSLLVVPYAEEQAVEESLNEKVVRAKRLLSQDSSAIELHDAMIDEVKRFLTASAEDHFKVQGSFSIEEFMKRMAKYEEISLHLRSLLAVIAYWAKPSHRPTFQKVFARSTDRLSIEGG